MSRSSLLRLGQAAALLAAVVLLAGCGRSSGSITGKVTYQGKTLKGGNVSFISTDGGQSYAAPIKEDGTYEVPSLTSGSYKVCVETASLKPQMLVPTVGGFPKAPPKGKDYGPPPGAQVPEGYTPSSPGAASGANSAKRYVPIPPKYGDPETTDMTYEFKGGSTTYDIDLK